MVPRGYQVVCLVVSVCYEKHYRNLYMYTVVTMRPHLSVCLSVSICMPHSDFEDKQCCHLNFCYHCYSLNRVLFNSSVTFSICCHFKAMSLIGIYITVNRISLMSVCHHVCHVYQLMSALMPVCPSHHFYLLSYLSVIRYVGLSYLSVMYICLSCTSVIMYICLSVCLFLSVCSFCYVWLPCVFAPDQSNLFSIPDNVKSQYLKKGQVFLGSSAENDAEVQSDISTSFFILLAIFFPSVTGLFQLTHPSNINNIWKLWRRNICTVHS